MDRAILYDYDPLKDIRWQEFVEYVAKDHR